MTLAGAATLAPQVVDRDQPDRVEERSHSAEADRGGRYSSRCDVGPMRPCQARCRAW
jgi:hypothetical protein